MENIELVNGECSTTIEVRRDQALDRLKKAGLRRTTFRRNLITLLLEKEPYALSIEEIHTHLSTCSPDLVTVYRNVDALTRIGIFDCISEDRGRSRFKLNETKGPKLKVTCRDCHATHLSPLAAIPQLETLVRQLGYAELNIKCEAVGYCENCASKHSG